MASPHARGSTAAPQRIAEARLGFPACAGIDLPAPIELVGIERLPRMRGDRPPQEGLSWRTWKASPHARGSTWLGAIEGFFGFGFPACAGIDPRLASRAPNTDRLPRMRGDRPLVDGWLLSFQMASPHARGSTPVPSLPRPPGRGFPACAGIDPVVYIAAEGGRGLPRMRGDRPPSAYLMAVTAAASPHARGSTRHVIQIRAIPVGFPACAGIDPDRG